MVTEQTEQTEDPQAAHDETYAEAMEGQGEGDQERDLAPDSEADSGTDQEGDSSPEGSGDLAKLRLFS